MAEATPHLQVFEMFTAAERVIVSPAAGTYEPAATDGVVEAGAIIGHVRAGADTIPVRSPFCGEVVEVVAWRGERLLHRQRVAWLRVAA
jgi:hypothetical protein